MCDAAEEAARKLDGQLRWYQREKLACRLKVCCVFQLMISFWFAFGPHGSRSYLFGTLCASCAIFGFHVANTCGRRLLMLHCACAVVVLLGSAALLKSAMVEAFALHAQHVTTFQLHLVYLILTSIEMLIQVPTLYVCASIILMPAAGLGHSMLAEARSFLVDEINEELLEIDLAVTPPSKEESEVTTMGSERACCASHIPEASASLDPESVMKLT